MNTKKYTVVYYFTVGRERLATVEQVEVVDIKEYVKAMQRDPVAIFEGWHVDIYNDVYEEMLP